MSILDIVKGIFLSILSLILIIDLSTYVILTSVKDNVMSASFYSGILERNGVYAKAQTFLLDSISSSGMTQQLPAGLTNEDVKEIVKQSVTVPWMQNQTDRLMGNIITYFTTDITKPDLTVSLKEIKPNIIAAVNASIQKKLPASNQTGNQTLESILPKLLIKCGSLDACFTYCQNNPSDTDCLAMAGAVTTPEAQAAMIAQFSGSMIPDKFDLYSQMDTQMKSSLANFKSMYKQISFGLTVMLGAAISIIVLMTLIAGIGNLKGVCRWIGSPLLMAGISLISVGLFVPGTAVKMVPAEMWKSMGTANAAFVQNLVTDILRTLFSSVTTNGLIIGLVGLILVIASFFLKPPEAKAKAEEAPKIEKVKKKK